MAGSIYNILIFFYKSALVFAALFNKKARLKTQGIRESKSVVQNLINEKEEEYIFIHCASQGEHEQALPIIRWVTKNTSFHIVVSFSSPSGFENILYLQPRITKIYLPFDTEKEMSLLISSLNPKYAIIVKNEWWWNLLNILKKHGIKTYLISATLRNDHYFIKYKMSFFVNGLKAFHSIFVVDEISKKYMSKVYSKNIVVAGDTRIDQVNFLKKAKSEEQKHRNNVGNKKVIVYGSIWEGDVDCINELIALYPDAVHLIYPHLLDNRKINQLRDRIADAQIIQKTQDADQNIHIIASMGELKYAYGMANLAYIGGGFGEGIHNILEAAVYYIPTLFGPNFRKSNEAKDLIGQACAFPIEKTSDLKEICSKINEEKTKKEIETKLKSYFSPANSPAEIICTEIFE